MNRKQRLAQAVDESLAVAPNSSVIERNIARWHRDRAARLSRQQREEEEFIRNRVLQSQHSITASRMAEALEDVRL